MTINTHTPDASSHQLRCRRPPLCYLRPRPQELVADHNGSMVVLAALTVGTGAVLWFLAYWPPGF